MEFSNRIGPGHEEEDASTRRMKLFRGCRLLAQRSLHLVGRLGAREGDLYDCRSPCAYSTRRVQRRPALVADPGHAGATVLAALAIPFSFAAHEEPLLAATQRSTDALKSALPSLAACTLIACTKPLTEPFATLHRYIHTASTYAALVWLCGIVVGSAVLWARAHRCSLEQPARSFRCQDFLSWFVVELLAVVIIN